MATANSRRNSDAHENDLYTTPSWAVSALLSRESFYGTLLDAGCGTGNISRVLQEAGYGVRSIDLFDHGYGEIGIDYLTFDESSDNTISNPPFKHLVEFITKALETSVYKVAIFARINVLETLPRYEQIFRDNKPHKIYLFVNRVKCDKGAKKTTDSSAVFYCWLVWDLKKPKANFSETHWIDDKAPRNPRKKRK